MPRHIELNTFWTLLLQKSKVTFYLCLERDRVKLWWRYFSSAMEPRPEPQGAKLLTEARAIIKFWLWLWLQVRHRNQYLNFYSPRKQYMYKMFIVRLINLPKVYDCSEKKVSLWRACNLPAFIHSSTGQVVHPFASRHEGPGFNPQGGTYVEPGFFC